MQGSTKKQQLGMHFQLSPSERHLDFNAPILSVRLLSEGPDGKSLGRRAATPTRTHKLSSELSAESLRAPGAVPFVWEQSPGKPKARDIEDVMYAGPPALPPGRPSPAALEKAMQDLSLETKPNTISREAQIQSQHSVKSTDSEFWTRQESSTGHLEHKSLGRLFKHGSKHNTTDQSVVSGPSEEKAQLPSNHKQSQPVIMRAASLTRSVTHLSSKNFRLAATSPAADSLANSSAYGMGNEDTYSDAAETMAPTDAATDACRVSIDGNDGGQELSQTAPEARDFILHRFLPAAKAMACDSPQTTSRMPLQEASNPFNNGGLSKGPLPLTPRPPPMRERVLLKEEEDGSHGLTQKACGFFFSHLRNALPNRSSQTHWLKLKKKGPSSLSRPGKLQDMMDDEALSGSDDEDMVAREVQASLQERRAKRKEQTTCPQNHSGSPRNTVGYRGSSPKHHQFMLEGDQTSNGSLIYCDALSRSSQTPDRSTSGCVTPYRNGAPMSPFHEGKGFLGLPKEWSTNGTVLRDTTFSPFETPRASMGDCQIVDNKGCANGHEIHAPLLKGCKPSALSQRVGKVLSPDTGNGVAEVRISGSNISSPAGKVVKVEEISHLQKLQPESLCGPSSLGRLKRLESVKTEDQNVGQNPVPGMLPGNVPMEQWQNGCSDIASHEASTREKMGWPLGISSHFIKSPIPSPGSRKCVERDSPVSVLSPPLPKSPSESWLWRAIPLNASLRTIQPMSARTAQPVPARKQLDSSTHSKAARWERVVKGSHVQPGHLRFSEELLHQNCSSVHVGKP